MLWKISLIVVFAFAAHLSLFYYIRHYNNNRLELNKTNLIIDTDAGGDDAVAILLALSVPDRVKVLAITCTFGNTWVNNVENNVLKILSIANHYNIPVYTGADKPLLRNFTATEYFGRDGMGDFTFDRQVLASVNRDKHAALAMVELAKQYPGEVNVMALGPTTNMALAISLDPNFSRNVKRFYVMGSSPLKVGFNFLLDPESSTILLRSVTTNTKLVISGGAVPPQEMLTKDWRINVLGKLNSERITFLNKAESVILRKLTYWSAADSIAISTILWPELVTNSKITRMTSDSCNEKPGSVKFEYNGDSNVEYVTEFNVTAFADKLLKHLA